MNLDIRKPLVSTLEIEGKRQLVEYEGLPTICFSCGMYGHLKENCDRAKGRGNEERGQVSAKEGVEVGDGSGRKEGKDAFGPWMHVSRRNGKQPVPHETRKVAARPNLDQTLVRPKQVPNSSHKGSRFSVLELEARGENVDQNTDQVENVECEVEGR